MIFDRDAEREIDRVCIDFEDALRDGRRVRIEDYLDRASASDHERLFSELMLLEIEYAGETCTVETLIERFPQYEPTIRRRLGGCSEAPPSQLSPGDRIGRYVVQEQVGQGTFGSVYKARDEVLQRWVALKSPKLMCRSTPDAVDRFLQEAISLANLSHPNILSIHDVIRDEQGWPLLVLEHIDAVPLDVSAPLKTVINQLIVVAEAMDYVHRMGFVHRDLKPENILIDSQGNAIVADFGLSANFDQFGGLEGESVGTPKYMSPEQVQGHSHLVDARSDIWSIGVILYEVIGGRPPFDGDDAESVAEAIMAHSVRPLRQTSDRVSKRLEDICLKCLRKSPEDRYSTSRDLANDLRRYQRERQSGFKRRAIIYPGVVLLILCLIGLSAASWWMDKKKSQPRRMPAIVDVDVHRDGQIQRLAAALPMRNGDSFEINVQTTGLAKIWIYWIEPSGSVWPLHPKDQSQSLRRPSSAAAAFQVHLPPEWSLVDVESGIATLVVLGAHPDVVPGFDLHEAFEGWQPQRAAMRRGVRFDFGIQSEFIGRGLKHQPATPQMIEGTVSQNQQRFRDPQFEAFCICRSICIPIRKDEP